jgi:hypothetical protein
MKSAVLLGLTFLKVFLGIIRTIAVDGSRNRTPARALSATAALLATLGVLILQPLLIRQQSVS